MIEVKLSRREAEAAAKAILYALEREWADWVDPHNTEGREMGVDKTVYEAADRAMRRIKESI